MATRELKLPDGKKVEAQIVEVSKITGDTTILELSDKSKIRIKIDVIEVCRADGRFDNEGYPMYHVRATNVIAVLDSPKNLRKKED